jgi:hypothetical protein
MHGGASIFGGFDTMKTVDFLDAVKTRHDLPSDYALAAFMEVSKQKISSYRSGHTLGDDVAVKVAELLDMAPGYVLACVHAERSTDATLAKVWLSLAKAAKKGTGAAAAVILSVTFSGGPDATNPAIADDAADALADSTSSHSIYRRL